MRKAAVVVLLLALAACRRENSRAPVIVGARAGDAGLLSEYVARRLESGGCRVERRLTPADTPTLDRQLGSGAIDVYVESHRDAVRDVLRRQPGEPPDNEVRIRTAWIRRDLVWAPILGVGDLAPVFRKDIDQKCREASRLLMRSAYTVDAQQLEALRRARR